MPQSTVNHLGETGARIAMQLRRHEERVTPAKVAVLGALTRADETPPHLTARELGAATAHLGIRLDEATVYRTLTRLEALGLVHAVAMNHTTRFGLDTPPHHHAVCDRCSALQVITAAQLDTLVASACALAEFSPGCRQAVTLNGVCGACAPPA
ncbi:hypothetical protein GCM10009539_02880 [Cryptosporangium japonicum]|uniref:Transcriptional repressor n=1 Tax=Cryptosporangium japonicum TaxID=80872 RepID=A0ABN0TGG2_9ACTN